VLGNRAILGYVMLAVRNRAVDTRTRPVPSEPACRRDFQKSRRIFLAVVLAAAAGLAVGQRLRAEPWVVAAVTTPPGTVRPHPVPRAGPVGSAGAGTSGKFGYVRGYGPVLGRAGPVRRFRVAVELPARSPSDFAAEVDRALGDPRSWIAGHRFRLRRVPGSAAAEFTVYLASARTSKRMCLTGGLRTDGYTSCRLPGRVIVNDSRWSSSVPGYGAPLATYRAYAINHEVGHQFGHGHEKCPGKGEPAPVMMQQTYGLRGCRANSWPYRNGKRWTGPPTA
jgi:uncharacterized protein DUF3152